MNSRTAMWLVAVGVVAACGRPPSPEGPAVAPRTTTPPSTTAPTTNTADEATTSAPPPTTVIAPEPHRTTTTAAPPPPPPPPEPKPPPPPPKPPDRWVLPDDLRKSIEQRTGQPFADVWAGVQSLLAPECPHDTPCVGYDLRVDETFVSEQDCVVAPNGIVVPDPLHEGGKIIFYVNNDRCPEV